MMTFACHRRDVATTTYRACARLLVAASFLLAAAVAVAQPAGKGLIIELTDGNELLDIGQVANTTPGTPTGVQLHVCWSAIQSSATDPDFYDWTELATWLEAAHSHGLKVILRIDMIGGATTGAGDDIDDSALSTPPWLFNVLNVAYIGGQNLSGALAPGDFPESGKTYIPRLPWYGDTDYQDRVAVFAAELHKFLLGVESPYTAEPDRTGYVEFIRIGGWQANSNEPNFYRDYTDPSVSDSSDCFPCDAWKTAVKTALIADLQAKGVTYNFDGKPVLDDVGTYADASKAMLDAWVAAFDGTGVPLSTTVNLRLRPCTADNEFLMHSLTNGMIILNPGLNAKAKTKTRDYYGQWSDPYGPFGVKVGWGGVKFPQGDPDHTRIGAAFEGFGWNGSSPLPDCIANSTNPDWTQYRHATLPYPTASYAIFGTNFLGTGQNLAFDCAREIIQAFTAQ